MSVQKSEKKGQNMNTRKRLVKGKGAKPSTIKGKEVMLSINAAGKNADGSDRSSIRIRFTKDACKKASSTGFVVVEIDEERGRLYFLDGTAASGYTLTGKGEVKTITITIHDNKYWEPYLGEYDMLNDVSEKLYYIDFAKVERKDSNA